MYELTHKTKRAVAKRLTFGSRSFRKTSASGTINTGYEFGTEHEVPPSGGHSAELAPPSDGLHSATEGPPGGAHSPGHAQSREHSSSREQYAPSAGEGCVELGLSLQVES